MTKSIFAGMTDYSLQSLDEILSDLNVCKNNLTDLCNTLKQCEAQLKNNGYWGHIHSSIRDLFIYSIKFFTSSLREIDSLLPELAEEVNVSHIKRIHRIGINAKELESDFAIQWHMEPWEEQKEYSNPYFKIAEKMYREARAMASDMIDLLSLSTRLEDFTGKTQAKNITNKRAETISLYIDQSRLNELQNIKSTHFDLSKLVRLCEELNMCYSNECYFATAMLGRAILDHVPPIFGAIRFTEVCNNYKAPKSFKESIKNLEDSLRHIADHHLHVQVRNKEILPSKSQVSFSANLDVLLGEIVRILK